VPQEYRAGLSEVLDLGEEMTVGTIPEGAEAVGAVPIATLESGDVTVLAAPEGDSSTEGYDFLGFRMAIGLHGPNLGRDGLNPEVLRLFDAAVQAAMANQ
jgi:hypothetical protein